jgi:hypothetical protein
MTDYKNGCKFLELIFEDVVELTNGWLSGLLADGGFSARIRKIRNKMGRQFIQKFSL